MAQNSIKHFKNIDISNLCQKNGLRLTAPRRIIMETLLNSHDHPDAVELHKRVNAIDPSISIATVYRTLNTLYDKGILDRHTFANRRNRYEAVVREHHDHLIDVVSGRVIEFRSDEIERLQEDVARNFGYEIVSHKLEIYVRPIKKRKP